MIYDIFTLSLLTFIITGICVCKIFENSSSLLGPTEGNFLLSPFPSPLLIGVCLLMMLYNVLLQTPTSLVPMKKYLLTAGNKKGKMGHQG
jgi:ACR3 family arsenite efflux pump ArsB